MTTGYARLREIVDEASNRLVNDRSLRLPDAIALTLDVRSQAEKLIPDMMELYDLIYESRFQRLIWQFVLPALDNGGHDADGKENGDSSRHHSRFHSKQK